LGIFAVVKILERTLALASTDLDSVCDGTEVELVTWSVDLGGHFVSFAVSYLRKFQSVMVK